MNPTPTPNSTAPVNIARLRELLAKATPGHWFEHWFRSGIPASKSDADFIATIRNEAPALLDEVERLRHQIKKPRSCDADEINELKSERDSLRQENEQLLKEIEGLKANQKESQ